MISQKFSKEIVCPQHNKKITHVSLINNFTPKDDVLLCGDCIQQLAGKSDRKRLPFNEITNFIMKFSSPKASDFYSYAMDIDKFRETFDKQGSRDLKKLKDLVDDEFSKLERSILCELEKLKIFIMKILDDMKSQLSSIMTNSDFFMNTFNYIKSNIEYIKAFREDILKCGAYEQFQQFYSNLNPNKVLQMYYDDAEKKKKEIRNCFLRYEEASTNFFTIVNVELEQFVKNSNLKLQIVNQTGIQINKTNLPFSNNNSPANYGKESTASYFNESSYFAANQVQSANFKISQIQSFDNKKLLFLKNNTLHACSLQFETYFPYINDSRIITKKFINFKLYTNFEAMDLITLVPHQDDNQSLLLYRIKNNELKLIPKAKNALINKLNKNIEISSLCFLCDIKPISLRRIKSIDQYEKNIDQKYWTLIFLKSLRTNSNSNSNSSSNSNLNNLTNNQSNQSQQNPNSLGNIVIVPNNTEYRLELWKMELDVSKGATQIEIMNIQKVSTKDNNSNSNMILPFEGNYIYYDRLRNILFIANTSTTQIIAFIFDEDYKQFKQLDDLSFQAFSNICARIIKIDRLEADIYYILLAGTNEDYLWIYKYDDRSQCFRIVKREDLKKKIRLSFNYNADKLGFVVKLGEENHVIYYYNWRNSTWEKTEKTINHIIDDIYYLDDERILIYAKYGEFNILHLSQKDNTSINKAAAANNTMKSPNASGGSSLGGNTGGGGGNPSSVGVNVGGGGIIGGVGGSSANTPSNSNSKQIKKLNS